MNKYKKMIETNKRKWLKHGSSKKGISKYKLDRNLEYKIKFCKCGCDNTIKFKKYHLYRGFGKNKRKKGLPDYINGHYHRGTKLSERHKLKIKTSNSGLKRSKITCDRIGKSKKGLSLSKVHKEKLSKKMANYMILNFKRSARNFKSGIFYSKKNEMKLYYQSSWELKFFKALEIDNKVLKYERCPFKIQYVCTNGNIKNYAPDVLVFYKDGSKVVNEIKPLNQINYSINELKFKAARKYCKNNNFHFKVLTQLDLFKESAA